MTNNELVILQEVLDGYDRIKTGEYRYAIFAINERDEIYVAKLGFKESSDADFISALPSNGGCYAVFGYECVSKDKVRFTKLMFFAWIPKSIVEGEKIKYASNTVWLRDALKGIAYDIQAIDSGELEEMAEPLLVEQQTEETYSWKYN